MDIIKTLKKQQDYGCLTSGTYKGDKMSFLTAKMNLSLYVVKITFFAHGLYGLT